MSYKQNSPIPIAQGGTGDTTLANHGVVVGAGSSGLNTITPSAASGIPLISQGASADPIFSTAVVAGGGTGSTSFTAYSLIAAGTTSTGNFQNVSGVGTSGQILTSNGAAALPSWQAAPASSISITGDSGGALTGNSFTFTGGTTGLTFAGAVSTETLGGTLNVAHGGTGNTTFTAYSVICAGTTATGIFQNVSGLGSSGQVLTSNGAGALPTWQSAGSSGITRINGDVDYVTGSTVTINTDVNGSCFGGKSVYFAANTPGGTFLQLLLTDDHFNTFLGQSAGVSHTVFAGGGNNTAVGYTSMASISSATTTGNSSLGYTALQLLTGGNNNTALGQSSGNALLTGQYNTLVGSATGTSYTSSESSNILIGHNTAGTTAESNTLRIGNGTGTGAGQLSSAYIQGVAAVSVSNKNYVTIDTTSGQLGSDSGPTSFTWSVITANQTAAVNNGYICNKAGTLTLALPATAAVGSIIEVTGINTATGWQITQASGQQIFFGASSTTSGATGTLTSSAIRDAIRMVCITANTTWQVLSSVGNITVV